MEIKINKRPPQMIDIMRQHYEENLRDEMAKAALIGALSRQEFKEAFELAVFAYKAADAMLKVRKGEI